MCVFTVGYHTDINFQGTYHYEYETRIGNSLKLDLKTIVHKNVCVCIVIMPVRTVTIRSVFPPGIIVYITQTLLILYGITLIDMIL